MELRNTDIQCAELTIYRYVAQLNQDRLLQNQPIHAQSIVWITDAPLKSWKPWTEAPKSPCRDETSSLGQERRAWLENLPIHYRSIQPGQFIFTVVDIDPTVPGSLYPHSWRTTNLFRESIPVSTIVVT